MLEKIVAGAKNVVIVWARSIGETVKRLVEPARAMAGAGWIGSIGQHLLRPPHLRLLRSEPRRPAPRRADDFCATVPSATLSPGEEPCIYQSYEPRRQAPCGGHRRRVAVESPPARWSFSRSGHSVRRLSLLPPTVAKAASVRKTGSAPPAVVAALSVARRTASPRRAVASGAIARREAPAQPVPAALSAPQTASGRRAAARSAPAPPAATPTWRN